MACPIRLSLPLLVAGTVSLLALTTTAAEQAKPSRPGIGDKKSAPKFEIPQEEKPFWKSAQAFIDAYAKRDADAIGALFTEDAEFFDEFGKRIAGRKALVETARSAFRNEPEITLHRILLEKVRYLSSTVAMEEGVVIRSDTPDGPRFPSRYVAIHVKQEDDSWLIDTYKESPRDEHNRAAHLSQLSWLLGEWVNEDVNSRVQTSCDWSQDGKFLLRQFVVSTRDGLTLKGTQRIVWDPVAKQLRSWTFDSDGGFSEEVWSRNGKRWVVSTTGVTGQGESSQAMSLYEIPNADTIVWQYRNVILNGQLAEDLAPVVMVRRPPAPKQPGKK